MNNIGGSVGGAVKRREPSVCWPLLRTRIFEFQYYRSGRGSVLPRSLTLKGFLTVILFSCQSEFIC